MYVGDYYIEGILCSTSRPIISAVVVLRRAIFTDRMLYYRSQFTSHTFAYYYVCCMRYCRIKQPRFETFCVLRSTQWGYIPWTQQGSSDLWGDDHLNLHLSVHLMNTDSMYRLVAPLYHHHHHHLIWGDDHLNGDDHFVSYSNELFPTPTTCSRHLYIVIIEQSWDDVLDKLRHKLVPVSFDANYSWLRTNAAAATENDVFRTTRRGPTTLWGVPTAGRSNVSRPNLC